MKSVTVNWISLPKVKEGTTKEFVLLCCILFLVAQSILPALKRENASPTYFRISVSPPDSLMLVASAVQPEEQNVIRPQLTPFFFKPVPLNSCDINLLLSVPGIGPSLANAILKTRADIGTFRDMQDLLLVRGIGQSRMRLFSKHFSFENEPL